MSRCRICGRELPAGYQPRRHRDGTLRGPTTCDDRGCRFDAWVAPIWSVARRLRAADLRLPLRPG